MMRCRAREKDEINVESSKEAVSMRYDSIIYNIIRISMKCVVLSSILLAAAATNYSNEAIQSK